MLSVVVSILFQILCVKSICKKIVKLGTKIKVCEPGAKNHRRKPTVGRTKRSATDRGISFKSYSTADNKNEKKPIM